MQHPEALNKDTLYELRNMLARHPYCQSVRMLYLKNLYVLHDIAFGSELRKSVLYIVDRRMLFRLIEGEFYRMQQRQESGEHALSADSQGGLSVDRTLALIDAFLAGMPQEVRHDIDYPIDDYIPLLLQTEMDADDSECTSPLKGHELIDDFIANNREKAFGASCNVEKSQEAEQTIVPDDGLSAGEEENYFTETLARIYIKQHRYSKALEIIKKLSLKYPKKSTYFATQIEALEKLIINDNSK